MIIDNLNRTKALIISSGLIKSYRIQAERVEEEEGYIRVKTELTNGDGLDLFEYYILDEGKVKLDKYSFHWQDGKRDLVRRWDNAPHHPAVRNFPHHVHFGKQEIRSGREMSTEKVLELIAKEIEDRGIRGIPLSIPKEKLA